MLSKSIFLFGATGVLADLPVHCPSRAFTGDWVFRHQPEIAKVALLQEEARASLLEGGNPDHPIWPELCGHEVPNTNHNNLAQDPHGKFDQWEGSSVMEMKVALSHNWRVHDVNGRPGTSFKADFEGTDGNQHKCDWTTAYDEGIMLSCPHPENKDVKRNYISFAEYECIGDGPNCKKDGLGENYAGRTEYHRSLCGHTNVGWFSDVSLLDGGVVGAGCWVGRRMSTPGGAHHSHPTSFLVEDTRSNPVKIPGTIRKTVGRHGTDDSVKKHYTVFPSEMFHKPPTGASLLELHNSYDGQDVSMYTPNSLLEVSSEVGVHLNHEFMDQLHQDHHTRHALSTEHAEHLDVSQSVWGNRWAASTLQKAAAASTAHTEACNCDSKPGMPNHNVYLELNNVEFNLHPQSLLERGDVDTTWDRPAIDQGSCGSCYSAAMTYALQSRTQIALRKMGASSMVDLSAESPMACGWTNQECAGGYPALVGKHMEEFGVSLAECQPYTAGGSKCNMGCHSDPAKVMYASSSGYLGGAYGKCSAASIMMEIYDHGPITAALEVPSDMSIRRVIGPAPDHHVQLRDRDHAEVGFLFSNPKSSNLQTGASSSLQIATRVSQKEFASHYQSLEAGHKSFLRCLGKYAVSGQAHSQGRVLIHGSEMDEDFQGRLKDCVAEVASGGASALQTHSTSLMEKQHRRNLLQKQNGENEVDHLRGSALESADGEKTGVVAASMVQVGRITDLTFNDWEYTNHAITLNGWGSDGPTPYWSIRNSWGSSWGDGHGFGKMFRGANANGIESQAVYVTPDFRRGLGAALLEKHGLTHDDYLKVIKEKKGFPPKVEKLQSHDSESGRESDPDSSEDDDHMMAR